MGKHLGFSDKHSPLVAIFHYSSTGCISPWFHLVFHDLFEMIICTRDDESDFNSICNYMFE